MSNDTHPNDQIYQSDVDPQSEQLTMNLNVHAANCSQANTANAPNLSHVNAQNVVQASRCSAFSPYRPSTVLTNLQRGNIQTQTSIEPPVRSIHQLAALGELFFANIDLSYVNKVDEKGLTPIFWAASYGQLASLKLLQAHGADVNYRGPFGETALLLASANGHSNVVKELLLRGVNVNDVDEDGNSALMFAAYGDHQSCVKELLANGADLSLENSNLDTAYDISVKRRCKEIQSIIEKHILNSLGSG